MSALGDRIHQVARKIEGKQAGLARLLDVEPNTVSRWVNGKSRPDDKYLIQISEITGTDLDWLRGGGSTQAQLSSVLSGLGRDLPRRQSQTEQAEFHDDFTRAIKKITDAQGSDDGESQPFSPLPEMLTNLVPVRGTAAGALAGSMAMSGDAIDFKRRPAGLEHVRDAYALYVVGTSMQDRYRAGDLIFVHPHRPYIRGDVVVIQTQDHDGADILAWLKEFVADSGGVITVRQYNKEGNIQFKRSTVKAIHRVLSNNELYGI